MQIGLYPLCLAAERNIIFLCYRREQWLDDVLSSTFLSFLSYIYCLVLLIIRIRREWRIEKNIVCAWVCYYYSDQDARQCGIILFLFSNIIHQTKVSPFFIPARDSAETFDYKNIYKIQTEAEYVESKMVNILLQGIGIVSIGSIFFDSRWSVRQQQHFMSYKLRLLLAFLMIIYDIVCVQQLSI